MGAESGGGAWHGTSGEAELLCRRSVGSVVCEQPWPSVRGGVRLRQLPIRLSVRFAEVVEPAIGSLSEGVDLGPPCRLA